MTSPAELGEFVQAMHNVVAPLTNCFGFVDGSLDGFAAQGKCREQSIMDRSVYIQ